MPGKHYPNLSAIFLKAVGLCLGAISRELNKHSKEAAQLSRYSRITSNREVYSASHIVLPCWVARLRSTRTAADRTPTSDTSNPAQNKVQDSAQNSLLLLSPVLADERRER